MSRADEQVETADLLVPPPSWQAPIGELGLGGGGGVGLAAGNGEDGPNYRPGLGTLPAHEFHAPGL